MQYKVGQLIEIPMGADRQNIIGVLVKEPYEQVYGPLQRISFGRFSLMDACEALLPIQTLKNMK